MCCSSGQIPNASRFSGQERLFTEPLSPNRRPTLEIKTATPKKWAADIIVWHFESVAEC
jgi:hypothetical protein